MQKTSAKKHCNNVSPWGHGMAAIPKMYTKMLNKTITGLFGTLEQKLKNKT